MAEWSLNLPNGIKLRNAIDNEEYELIYTEIINGYRYITAYFADSYEEALENFEFESRSVTEDLEFENYDEDNVNYQLSEFYDYCDALKVWIPTDEREVLTKSQLSKINSNLDDEFKIGNEKSLNKSKEKAEQER